MIGKDVLREAVLFAPQQSDLRSNNTPNWCAKISIIGSQAIDALRCKRGAARKKQMVFSFGKGRSMFADKIHQ